MFEFRLPRLGFSLVLHLPLADYAIYATPTFTPQACPKGPTRF